MTSRGPLGPTRNRQKLQYARVGSNHRPWD
jgi:hypothetical protein